MDLNINLKIKTKDIFIDKIELDCIIKSDIEIELTEEEIKKNMVKRAKTGCISVFSTEAYRLKIKWIDEEAPIVKHIWFYNPLSDHIRKLDGDEVYALIKDGLKEYYKRGDLLDILDKIKFGNRVKKILYMERDVVDKIKDLSFKYEYSFNMIANALAYLGLKKRKLIK